MRVRVSYSIEADSDYRRAVAFRLRGEPEPIATRDEIVAFCREYGSLIDDDLRIELDEYEEMLKHTEDEEE